MSKDDIEYEEITDYKKVFIVIGIMAISGIIGLFYFGVLPFPLDVCGFGGNVDDCFVFPNEVTSEEILEEIKNPEEIISNANANEEQNLSINDQLIEIYSQYGLEKEDIIFILTGDCQLYLNGTINDFIFFNDPKYEELILTKTDLCNNG